MNEKTIIEEALKSVGWTQATLAEACGYGTQSAISNKLYRKNGMRVDIFVKMLNAMGYDLVVQSKNTAVNKNKWIVGGETK